MIVLMTMLNIIGNSKGVNVFNIKTKITNPKIYEFLKDDDIYHFTFLIKLDPF